MTSTNAPENPVSPVGTAFDILEILLARNGASLTELDRELGLAKSTVHRHLQTLYHREYVVREDDSYYMSFRFLEFGKHAQNRKKGVTCRRGKLFEEFEHIRERGYSENKQENIEGAGKVRFVALRPARTVTPGWTVTLVSSISPIFVADNSICSRSSCAELMFTHEPHNC